MIKSRMFFTKQAADATGLEKAAEIMRTILEENPTYWPYGLNLGQFTNRSLPGGGLYLISKSAAHEPVGFVGWQVCREKARNVGYYAIGVLPEHRGRGFAKAAVESILREKAASVDEVCALVCSHNRPSLELARSLPGVRLSVFEKVASITKEAISGKAQALGSLIGALGSTALFDQTADPRRTMESTLKPWTWDKPRALMGTMNAVLGGIGGQQMTEGFHGGAGHIAAGLASIATAPAKDLMLKGTGSLSKLDNLTDVSTEALSKAPSATAPTSILGKIPTPVLMGALGLGAGGLGLAAYMAKKRSDTENAQTEAARAGRVHVTLPSKEPGGTQTTLDLPVDDIQLTDALRAHLGRDTKRRLYAESRERTRHRKPRNPSAPTPDEASDMQLDREAADLDKTAGIVDLLTEIRPGWFVKQAAAQPMVPSPPGGSPAQRMQQQAATANSISTSTTDNPQIMKAQQDAAQASMEAQQQVAQAEQAQQQAQMEQQKKFQDQMVQQDEAKQQVAQENQMLKMKLEQSKVEKDLLHAKFKARDEINKTRADADKASTGGSDDRLGKLIENRIARVRSRMSKVAAIDATTGLKPPNETAPLDPKTGLHPPPKLQELKPWAAQGINDDSFAYSAGGGAPRIGVNRASYGGVGDFLYSNFVRQGLLTPTQQGPGQGIGAYATLNNPDKMQMFENVDSSLANSARQQYEMYMRSPQLTA